MNQILKLHHLWLIVAIGALSACATRQPGQVPDRSDQARTISLAFVANQPTAWRVATARELATLRTLPGPALDVALTDYRQEAAERGLAGLEPVILAAVTELAARSASGAVRAREQLMALSGLPATDKSGQSRPNAFAPVLQRGGRLALYIPLPLVQAQLSHAMVSLRTGHGQLARETLCTEKAIADFRARWGDAKADKLQELCKGALAGQGAEDAFPGITNGIAEYGCEIGTEPTRAERLTAAMTACLQSTMAHGGGNPLAQGSVADVLDRASKNRAVKANEQIIERGNGKTLDDARLNQENAYSIQIEADSNGRVLRETITTYTGEQIRHHYDENGTRVFTVSASGGFENGDVELSYDTTDPNTGERTTIVMHIDAGNGGYAGLTQGKENYTVAIQNGTEVERVTQNNDGGYTVTRPDGYSQTYDKDGRPVDGANGGATPPPPKQADPTEWGATPECQALNRALAEERLRGELESDGIVSPKTVNPNPESDGDTASAGCFLSANISIDSAMLCGQLVLCGAGSVPNDQCGCQRVNHGVVPESHCSYQMTCSDGASAVENPQSRNCRCNPSAQAVFTDAVIGGGFEREAPMSRRPEEDFRQAR